AQKTPTLSVVLPLYAELIETLEAYKQQPGLKRIAHVYQASIDKLNEYLDKARTNRVYALAMAINPTIKFRWLREHTTREEFDDLRDRMRQTLLEFQIQTRERQASAQSVIHEPGAPRSVTTAEHVVDGRERLRQKRQRLSNTRSSSTSSLASNPEQTTGTARMTAGERAEHERLAKQKQDEEDRALAHPTQFLQDHEDGELSLWFRAAMDILPIQASAVPCERVFSSSKETDSLRRANIAPEMMEMLQILKYTLRQQELDFTEGLLATEEECARLDEIERDTQELKDLMSQGKYEEARRMLDGTWGCDAPSPTQMQGEESAINYGLLLLLSDQAKT
ncbi:hypothetical protein K523DRAFT_243539, partial [Schizophyllum commune Tattone D]